MKSDSEDDVNYWIELSDQLKREEPKLPGGKYFLNNEWTCIHHYKKYEGVAQAYEYCVHCGDKKE